MGSGQLNARRIQKSVAAGGRDWSISGWGRVRAFDSWRSLLSRVDFFLDPVPILLRTFESICRSNVTTSSPPCVALLSLSLVQMPRSLPILRRYFESIPSSNAPTLSTPCSALLNPSLVPMSRPYPHPAVLF